ncbi:MAG: tetratricopeptide repeat protein [Permianibacter sp.]
MKPASAPPSHEPVLTPAALSRFGLPTLLLLTILAYLNSFAGVWQFDDHAVLLADPRVQSLSAWWQSLPHIRPLFKLSVAMQHQFDAGLFGFHLFNLALHLANTLLLFRFLQILLAQHVRKPSPLALLITAVFALHPAQTEVVTYLSGRSVALEGFGLLLALNLWQHWLINGKQHSLLWLLPALLIALGSRESAVVAPLWLAWLWFCYRDGSRRVMWFALAAATGLLIVVLLLPRYRELLWLALQWRDLESLLAVQTQAIVHLFAVAVGWQALNADPVLSVAPLASGRGIACAVAVLALLVLAWRQRQQRTLLWLAVCWLALSWLPTHSLFVRLDPVNDRQLYLALPGITLLLLLPLKVAANRMFRAANLQSLPALLSVMVAVALSLTLAGATRSRNTVYHSETAFWQDVVQKAPANARGWNNLGMAYQQTGHLAAAKQAFEQALVVRPDYRRAAVNLRLLRRQLAPSR